MIIVKQAWDAIDYEFDEKRPKDGAAVVYYIASGSTSETEILSAVQRDIPDYFIDIPGIAEYRERTRDFSFSGLPLHSVKIDERLTHTDWRVSVSYGGDDINKGGGKSASEYAEPSFNFSVSTQSRRIIASYGQISKTPANAPDSLGIGDGDGADILFPVCTISETHFYRASKINDRWKRNVARMVGSINQSEFWGYAPGELLFIGCNGLRNGDRSKNKWQITFEFAVAPTEKDIKIGKLTIKEKRGWDYLWVRYRDQVEKKSEDGLYYSGRSIRVPVAAYVERVYPWANFQTLRI